MITLEPARTPRWFWLPAIGMPALLCVALAVGIAQTTTPNASGTALGDGQYGVDIGLGMLGSYTHSLARLATVTNKAPAPAVPKTNASARPDISSKNASTLTQPLQTKADVKAAPSNTAANVPTDAKNSTATDASAATAPINDPNAVIGDNNQAGSTAMNLGTGIGHDQTAGGRRGDSESYQNSIMRKLARYKEYPARAISQQQQGVVHLAFTLDRKGNVLNYSIYKSSGFPLLDRAALQMIRDANPLPAFPDHFYPERQQLDLILPFEYSLINP